MEREKGKLTPLPLPSSDAIGYARKAVASWTSLSELSPEVAVIVAAFEQAAPMLAEVVHTGFGSVTIKVSDKRLGSVYWEQARFYTTPY